MTEAESLWAKFLDELVATDTVRHPEWLAAFRDIPRDAFVPSYFVQRPGEPGWLLLERPDSEWLAGVYSSQALITQIDGDDDNAELARTGRVNGVATSSSSAPSLMALMLEALDAREGHKVLEVGTGTGYNAALLCHRLGPDNVTSVDVDAGLVSLARERLAAFDYFPHLEATDGAAGCPGRAPFDRIISTVALARVPSAWTGQTTPGGKILVPLDLAGRAGLLALLTVYADGKAEGPFLSGYGGFMPLRANQHQANDVLSKVGDDDGTMRETALPVDVATNARDPFEFFAALIVGGYDWLGFTPSDGGPAQTWLTQPNGSWVCHVTDENGKHIVRQGGPVRLWDGIETAHLEWQQLGQPVRSRFGLTVKDERHTVWLDHPEAAQQRWTLPA
jgi:methyltransferase of ATP-grasp peptide maturase system